MKIKWRPILLTGLALLLGSLVLTGGCSSNLEVAQPELGPLESPFSEIIPSAQDLFISLFLSPYHCSEETIYYPDGVIGYSRMFANESACYSSLSDAPKPESPSVMLSMFIYNYQDEEQALGRICKEKERRLYDISDTEFYSKSLELPIEDIAVYVIFWKEPTDDDVKGEEHIFFRIGHYVGDYMMHISPPPEIEDGYFIPPLLHDLLETSVKKTILKLRPIRIP